MTINLPKLSYLDDRPIWELDRIAADAYREGGEEAEKKAWLDFAIAKEWEKESIRENTKWWEEVG